ncbi:dipeptidylpeptidase [Coemansia sp. RSA 2336]|nr:dipeptidylpeptidase [Coemansia sp. RSA 2336]
MVWLVSFCAVLACAARILEAAPAYDVGEGQSKALRPLDSRLFHSLTRIGAPVVQPDQTRALYTTSRYDPDLNKSYSRLLLLDASLGESTPLTPEMEGERISSPMWLHQDVAGYVFKGALYQHNLTPNTNGTLLFNTSVGISSATYRQKTETLFFTADVFPDGNISSVPEHKEQERNRRDSAQVFDNLWARHWNKWMTLEKPNLFAAHVPLVTSSSGSEVNLMRQLVPTKDPLLRWQVEGYAVSSSGEHAAFVVRNPGPDIAWSTNVDIYLVACNSSNSQPRLLTDAYKGIASNPSFSVDGSAVAWLQMEKPGYEADIRRIFIHNIATGETRSIARNWNLSPHFILWSADGKTLHTLVQSQGNTQVVSIDIKTENCTVLAQSGSVSSIARLGSEKLLAVYSNTTEPADAYVIDLSDSAAPMQRLTYTNEDKLQDVYLGDAEDFWFQGALNEPVHGWMIRPYGFNASLKYPLALLIHGGPQQANSRSFSFAQWNPNMYASAGFVTVQINFHGSPGYGQNFTDSIQGQWGGYPYEDLMKGVDYVLATYGFVDSKRMVALGGSFGGYMANWINANTDRFAALVSHDGQFDMVSGYYTTDELWFIEHDVGGVPFSKDGRPKYEKFNPERLASKFKTPTLFVHGANDFRLSLEQSLAPWTLLRRRGIPARLVYFENEDHWINHAGNSMRWYQEVLGWIAQWTSDISCGSRFIINVPEEELQEIERICFQIEQAHWFYEDFIREKNRSLPSMTLKTFAGRMFKHCPLLSQWANNPNEAYQTFLEYKFKVPVCGAIILNPSLDKVLLVKGWSSRSSWGFPRGKINKDEPEWQCAQREVIEETGFDILPYLVEQDRIEITQADQKVLLYIIAGIPEDTTFVPTTRKEISQVKWHHIDDLPCSGRADRKSTGNGIPMKPEKENRYYLIKPFIKRIKSWVWHHQDRLGKPAFVVNPQGQPPAGNAPAASTTEHQRSASGSAVRLAGSGAMSVQELFQTVNRAKSPHANMSSVPAQAHQPAASISFPVGSSTPQPYMYPPSALSNNNGKTESLLKTLMGGSANGDFAAGAGGGSSSRGTDSDVLQPNNKLAALTSLMQKTGIAATPPPLLPSAQQVPPSTGAGGRQQQQQQQQMMGMAAAPNHNIAHAYGSSRSNSTINGEAAGSPLKGFAFDTRSIMDAFTNRHVS